MPTPIKIDEIGRDNPHLNMEKIKRSCEARSGRKTISRGYNLAQPTDRRTIIVGRPSGSEDPRTIRLRASRQFISAINSSSSQT